MSNKLHYKFISCIFSLVVLISGTMATPIQAQAYIAPISHILPDATIGNPYPAITFSLENATVSGITTYEYSIVKDNFPYTGDFKTDTNLDLQANGQLFGTVHNSSDLSFGAGVYRITVNAINGGNTIASQEYLLNLGLTTGTCNNSDYKISLILDASGSMNAAASNGDNRWQELQKTVESYIPSLAVWMKNNDRLKVVHFQGLEAKDIYDDTFGSTNWSDINSVRNALFGTTVPGGGTPLGKGIEDSGPYSADRHAAIIFTDGYENGCPLALPSLNTNISCPTSIVMPNTTFYAIGYAGHNQNILNGLAGSGSGGGSSAHTLVPGELDPLFQSTIPRLFRGCTPRIVTFKRGQTPFTTSASQLTETFRVDSLVRKLTARLKCRSGDCGFGRDARLSLNGVPVAEPNFNQGGEIRFALDLPIIDSTRFRSIDGGGSWTLSCTANPGSEYELMVIVDDKIIKVETTVNNNQPVYVGDPITIRTEASYLGSAFNGLEAEAFLLKPGEDPGNLFSDTNIDLPSPLETNPAPGLSQSSLIAQAKISGLLIRPDILQRLRNQSNRIPLVRTADGRYTGTFPTNASEVSSHYRIMVRYKGYQRGLDSIQGMTIDHFLVQFGRTAEIDLQSSRGKWRGGEGSAVSTYTFKPTNKFGNHLGPANARNIVFLQDGDPVILQDKLNGTYEARVGASYGQRPKIEIYVNDYEKPVIKRRVGPAIGLSVHSGILRMLEAPAPFENLSEGTYYEADLTARFSSTFDLEAIIGQNEFEDDLTILAGGLYAGFTINRPSFFGFKPRIQVGASYYNSDLLDDQAGAGARLGLGRFFSPNLQLGVEAGGSYLFDSEILFVKGGVFLKYFF